MERTTNDFSGSYVRYEYPPEQNVIKSFATITEGQGEAYSATFVDGHGRIRISISELPSNYTFKTTSIYVNGAKIARSYDGDVWYLDGAVGFEYPDPITGTTYLYSPGQGGCCAGGMIETDPLGQEVGTYDPGPEGYGDIGQYPEPHEFGNADDPRQGCEVDGIMHTPCSDLMRFANSGALRFRVQWYGNGSFRESSYNIDVVLGITANLRWNPVSGRDNPATPDNSPIRVGDGDVVKVDVWGDGGIWEYVELDDPMPDIQGEHIQTSFHQAYVDCKSQLGNSPEPGVRQASYIVQAADATEIDRTLFAVTWNEESRFVFYPPNGIHGRNELIGDIGPGQLFPGVWDKSPYIDGLKNPFGSNREVGQIFNGNFDDNLLLMGRALHSFFGNVTGDKRAEAAGLYKAGSTTGPGYSDRVKKFNEQKNGYDKFFDCLRKAGY